MDNKRKVLCVENVEEPTAVKIPKLSKYINKII